MDRALSKLLALPIVLGSLSVVSGSGRTVLAQSWGIVPPANSSDTSETMETREPAPLVADAASYEQYGQVIERTKAMLRDSAAQRLAAEKELQILDVTWEDTGRYDNSTVGPNISDMTIQVEHRDPRSGQSQLHLMPVIRYPNFSDRTADIPLQNLSVLTGNEKGEAVEPTLLADVLEDLRAYLSEPDSWTGRGNSLLAERDSHILVSAQAAFLPIPQSGEATFNPVLFNYQSYPGDPAVLTILATREGTSVTVIDNQRDGFDAGRTWGQRLFFNKDGDRASLTGKRISDFRAEQTESDLSEPLEVSEEAGLNMVMLIQVPLKQKEPFGNFGVQSDIMLESAPMPLSSVQRAASNVEAAVIGHGEVEGPFTEIDNLAIERDPDFPIRATIQFYKATDNGVVSAADIAEIDEQIQRIYADADYVGSLVTDGRTGRPTEYEGEYQEPADWWEQFWQHSENRLGMDRDAARDLLRRLRGSSSLPADIRYERYRNQRFDYTLLYPSNVLSPQGEATDLSGQTFLDEANDIQLRVYAESSDLETLAQRYEQAQTDRSSTYQTISDDFFVVSGTDSGKIFYHKTLLEDDVFKVLEIEYDQALQREFDTVAQAIADSFASTGSRSGLRQLPESVQTVVLDLTAANTEAESAVFEIVSAQRETWSDGCLGLPQSDELCTQALVPGWRVKVEANLPGGLIQFTYRTDETGEQIRFEDQ